MGVARVCGNYNTIIVIIIGRVKTANGQLDNEYLKYRQITKRLSNRSNSWSHLVTLTLTFMVHLGNHSNSTVTAKHIFHK